MNRFEDFVGIISNIHKNIEKIKKNKMREFGLSGNHVMCLHYLAQYKEGLTAAELCQLISVDKAATSRTLSELLEKEFVYYPNLDGVKKYRVKVKLTEKGIFATKQIDQIIDEVVEEIGKDLSEGERTAMYRSLNSISNNLEQLIRSL